MTANSTEEQSASGERPHLVFLNRSFWPDTEATGQLLTDLAVDLSAWFDVTVIAGQPNHVELETDRDYQKTENYRGVNIVRAWHTRFSKHSTLGRIANLASFTASALFAGRNLKRKPDVIVVQTDPFFLPLVGRHLLRRFKNTALVCHLQDIYPDIAVAVGKIGEGSITRTLRRLLVKVYRDSNRVLVLSHDMRRHCERLGVPDSKLAVVANWADTEMVFPVKTKNEFRREHSLEDRFVVMYSGNMGLAHELDTLLDVASRLRERDDIEWVFIGDGARRQSLRARAQSLGLKNVRFLPYQPRKSLAQSLSAADVHIVSLRPGASTCVMPSKLYGILASGTPAIALAEQGTDLHDLIHDHNVGFNCEPGNSTELAGRIEEMAANPQLVQRLGQNARKLAETTYSRTRQTACIAEVLFQTIYRDTPIEVSSRVASRQTEASSHGTGSSVFSMPEMPAPCS